VAVAQSCEPCEIAIARYELAAVLDSKCRVVCVGNEFSSRLRFNAKVGEYSPTVRAVGERPRIESGPQAINEGNGV